MSASKTEWSEATRKTQEQYLRSRQSSVRAQMTEHMFLAELMQEMLFGQSRSLEIARAETDVFGYDLVLTSRTITRYVQMKTSHRNTYKRDIPVQEILMLKPSGCVLWVKYEIDWTANRQINSYHFYGGKPGHSLPTIGGLILAKRPTRRADGKRPDRPHTRLVPARWFQKLSSMREVAIALFGEE